MGVAAIAAVCLLVATGMMENKENSYWELFGQQISRGEILLGDQIQNMLAQVAAGSLILAQRKRVIFRKEGTVKQARR